MGQDSHTPPASQGVVVARGDEHPGPHLAPGGQGLLQGQDGPQGRLRGVEQVTGQEHQAYSLAAGQLHQALQALLAGLGRLGIQGRVRRGHGAAQVQVGGQEDASRRHG